MTPTATVFLWTTTYFSRGESPAGRTPIFPMALPRTWRRNAARYEALIQSLGGWTHSFWALAATGTSALTSLPTVFPGGPYGAAGQRAPSRPIPRRFERIEDVPTQGHHHGRGNHSESGAHSAHCGGADKRYVLEEAPHRQGDAPGAGFGLQLHRDVTVIVCREE